MELLFYLVICFEILQIESLSRNVIYGKKDSFMNALVDIDKEIIKKTIKYVKKTLQSDSSGHDWSHIDRVRKTSINIAEREGGADMFVLQLAALLHDIADHKFHGGDTTVGPRVAREWLESLSVASEVIDRVEFIVAHISFNGGKNKVPMSTKEGMIVQDADRLDSIGAVGIARTFACGSSMGNEIEDSIQHFYDKLLLLKDKMNTNIGREMAEERHGYLQNFLDQYYKECGG